MVICRLARPLRADRSALRQRRRVCQRLLQATRERGCRLLQRVAPGSDRQVPDRHQQTVRAERSDQPRVLAQPVAVGRMQPRERGQQGLLVVRHHPAQVLLGADRGPVRRLDGVEPQGRVDGRVQLLQGGGHVGVVLVASPRTRSRSRRAPRPRRRSSGRPRPAAADRWSSGRASRPWCRRTPRGRAAAPRRSHGSGLLTGVSPEARPRVRRRTVPAPARSPGSTVTIATSTPFAAPSKASDWSVTGAFAAGTNSRSATQSHSPGRPSKVRTT